MSPACYSAVALDPVIALVLGTSVSVLVVLVPWEGGSAQPFWHVPA